MGLLLLCEQCADGVDAAVDVMEQVPVGLGLQAVAFDVRNVGVLVRSRGRSGSASSAHSNHLYFRISLRQGQHYVIPYISTRPRHQYLPRRPLPSLLSSSSTPAVPFKYISILKTIGRPIPLVTDSCSRRLSFFRFFILNFQIRILPRIMLFTQ